MVDQQSEEIDQLKEDLLAARSQLEEAWLLIAEYEQLCHSHRLPLLPRPNNPIATLKKPNAS